MWILSVVIIGAVFFYIFRISKPRGPDGSIVEIPLDILKKRYAKGEIDKEEFERKKNELES